MIYMILATNTKVYNQDHLALSEKFSFINPVTEFVLG